MKKRADGRYCKQVLIGYQPDGRKKYKNIYGLTIKEVEKKERELRCKIEQGRYIENQNITIAEWAKEWLNTYKTDVEYNTFQRYKAVIKNQINPLLGEYNLSSLRLNIIQRLINQLSEKYSSSTLHKFKITLNQLYKCAIKLQMVYVNPCDGLVIPKKENRIRDAIPSELIPVINQFCVNYKHGDLIMTLLYTGLRRGELIPLTWNDIDFENNCIHVNKAVEYIGNQPNIKTPKTKNSIRAVPILDILKPYLIKPPNTKVNDLVFKNSLGNIPSLVSIRRLYADFVKSFQKYLSDNEINFTVDFTMHQFRHTYATILYKAGVDIKTAQSYLGHSSIDVTMDIYTHLDQKHKALNADKLNQFLSPTNIKLQA